MIIGIGVFALGISYIITWVAGLLLYKLVSRGRTLWGHNAQHAHTMPGNAQNHITMGWFWLENKCCYDVKRLFWRFNVKLSQSQFRGAKWHVSKLAFVLLKYCWWKMLKLLEITWIHVIIVFDPEYLGIAVRHTASGAVSQWPSALRASCHCDTAPRPCVRQQCPHTPDQTLKPF